MLSLSFQVSNIAAFLTGAVVDAGVSYFFYRKIRQAEKLKLANRALLEKLELKQEHLREILKLNATHSENYFKLKRSN